MNRLYVLDASAVLAAINMEAGHESIHYIAFDSVISTVTLAEVHTKLHEWDPAGAKIASELLQSLRDIVPFTPDQAILCGELQQATRAAGLSLGDRACIALATIMNAEVVTCDRTWADLQLPCRVQVFR